MWLSTGQQQYEKKKAMGIMEQISSQNILHVTTEVCKLAFCGEIETYSCN